MENILYLLVNLGCLSIPFAFSFGRKVSFYKSWGRFAWAFFTVAIPFIAWDVWFTLAGYWGFNPDYLLGIEIIGLPLEEWLFFICVPYACLFTYEFVRYFRGAIPGKFPLALISILTCVFLVLVICSWGKMYSSISFGLSFLFLLLTVLRKPTWTRNFLVMFVIILVPFFISNGVLTGIKFWEYPLLNLNDEVVDSIVWYSGDQILGLRLFSIPAEDISYAFSLLGLQVWVIEFLREKVDLRNNHSS